MLQNDYRIREDPRPASQILSDGYRLSPRRGRRLFGGIHPGDDEGAGTTTQQPFNPQPRKEPL